MLISKITLYGFFRFFQVSHNHLLFILENALFWASFALGSISDYSFGGIAQPSRFVQVNLGRLQTAVPEHLLRCANIRAAVNCLVRCRVAQAVNRLDVVAEDSSPCESSLHISAKCLP
jgi:hypothetical protein